MKVSMKGIIIISVIIVLAIFALLILRSFLIEPTNGSEEIRIYAKPTGHLNYCPSTMRFTFSGMFIGERGLKISSDSISYYIETKPHIDAEGVWISEKEFQLDFKSIIEPGRDYSIFIKRIPLPYDSIYIKSSKFSFTAPEFEPLRIAVKDIRNGKATVIVGFNYNIIPNIVKNDIIIKDSNNKIIKITDVFYSIKGNKKELSIKFPTIKKGSEYRILFKKGLISEQGFLLKKDKEMKVVIGFSNKPINLYISNVQESGDEYSVKINVTTVNNKRVKIQEQDISNYFSVCPEIPIKISAYSGYISVFGSFSPEEEYELTVSAGLKGTNGEILEKDYTLNINAPAKKSQLSFLYNGKYFGKQGGLQVPLKVYGIDTVNIKISYMPVRNVALWYSCSNGSRYSAYKYMENLTVDHKIIIDKNGPIWIDLREIAEFSQYGIYFIEARGKSKEGRWFTDVMELTISDMSIISKWSKDKVNIWVVNNTSLKPEANVEIEAWSRNNFPIGTSTTNQNGYCNIPVEKENRQAYVVFAKKDNDWTFLNLSQARTHKETYDISGDIKQNDYIAYFYPERDIYRPGETIHFSVLVRNVDTYTGVNIPLKVQIRDPQGKKFIMLTGNTNNNGLAAFDLSTNASANTGKYAIQISTGDKNIYTGFIFIETFAPERMRLKITLPDEININKEFSFDVDAMYLFGAPASGENLKVKMKCEETPFKGSGTYNLYTFGSQRMSDEKAPVINKNFGERTLNKNGHATIIYKAQEKMDFYLPVKIMVYADVSEGKSGRVTKKVVEKTVYTHPYYIGLKPQTTYTSRNKEVPVNGVLVTPKNKLYDKKAKLTYRVYQVEYSYSYEYYDDFYWRRLSEKIPVTSEKKVTVTDGKFTVIVPPNNSYRDLLVEVCDENGGKSQVIISGWGWRYSRNNNQIPPPDVLNLRLNKEKVEPNEMVKVEALLPFEGKILWTVELDNIFIHEWREATGEKAKWEFKVPKDVPNVYVTALLIRSNENYLVSRAFGIERLRIRPSKMELPIEITAPEYAKPGEKIKIKLKSSEQFDATIAIVDEGILQLTNFITPDPYNNILRDRRLTVDMAEGFGWIVRKYLSRTGGGYASKESSYQEARFTRLVSYWSGIIHSNKHGKAEFEIKLPQFSGKLRIMAVGINNKKMGSSEKDIIVKSDVVISPTIPRFLYYNDEFQIPISLVNTTKSSKTVSLNASFSSISPTSWKKKITIKSEGTEVVYIKGKVKEDSHRAKFVISAKTGNEMYKDTFEIPLYPDSPFITEVTSIKVENNNEADLKKYFSDWFDIAHSAQIYISTIPGINKLHYARYGIHYPYGCIEQTSTSTILLLRISKILPIIAPNITMEKYRDMVRTGISKIISMQTISGGFSYWPGSIRPNEWSSIYATFVLLEAKDAGFVVSETCLNAALTYISSISSKNVFAYYVLAKGGKFKGYSSKIEELARNYKHRKYNRIQLLWIAGTLYECGKSKEASEALYKALEMNIEKGRRMSGSFYSEIKGKALSLYMIEQISSDIPEADELLNELSSYLSNKTQRYYTTQEIAWSTLAIGLYIDKHSFKEDVECDILINGKKAEIKKSKGLLTLFINNAPSKKNIKLKTNTYPLYLDIVNTGFSKSNKKFVPISNGIKMQRKIYSYNGIPVSSAKQGELLVMQVIIESTSNRYLENVAFEIPIPAGIEIENPRLAGAALPAWTQKGKNKKIWNPDYLDVRDEKIMLFGNLNKKSYYYILLRAVTPGQFLYPQAKGIVMYNPEINVNTAVDTFNVFKK